MEVLPDFLEKVKFLCRSISRVEWSGVLFYTIEGSIQDTANMKIILKDILLMDKGTSTFTDFDWDEDVVEYRMDNPEALDWHIGHIHSHNTMNVFFSHVDKAELNDNCPQHNFYLSVIVNNYMDIEAKVAFTAQPTVFTCKNELGKDYTMTLSNSPLEPFMFVYDCHVIMESQLPVVSAAFAERMVTVSKKSDQKAKIAAAELAKKNAAKAAQNKTSQPSFWGDGMSDKSKIPDYNPNKKAHEIDSFEDYMEHSYSAMEKGMFMGDDDIDGITNIQPTLEQEFSTYVVRLGTQEEDDDLIDALEDAEAAKLNPQSFATSIIESYGAYYEQFFDKKAGYEGDKAFMRVLEEVIGIYEEYEEDYKILVPVVTGLKSLGNKFENTIKETVDDQH